MKNLIFFLLFFLFILQFHQCKKSDLNNPNSCNTCLPSITTGGYNTFGCKVNGKNWIAKGNVYNPAFMHHIMNQMGQ